MTSDAGRAGSQSAESLRLFLDTVLDAVVVMASDGTVLNWNDRATDLFGWSRDEAVGRVMADLIIPERYRESHRRGLEKFLLTGRGQVIGRRIEIFALRKSGEEFPVELAISPIHEAGGVIFVGCLRDITAQRTVQHALRDTEQHFQILVQGVKDYAIYMLDRDGYVTTWNKGALAIKGYSAEEIIGQHYSRFHIPEDLKNGLPALALRQAANEGKFEVEGWRVRKDGTRFWASVVIDAIHDQSGTLIGFAKVTRDETERRAARQLVEQTRERMLEMQKMEAVGQLTGGVAHDFNNLLTIIIGNLETAQRQIGASTESVFTRLKRVIDNAMIGAQRAATLTQRLLAFSRRQPLSPRVLDVNRFTVGAAEFLQRSLGENVQVEAVGGAGVWPIEADIQQLEAALLNLAVNARDAMPDGGKLTIETSNAFLDQEYCRGNPEVAPGQYVLIGVTDAGMGMTKDVASRAFEPFFTTKNVGQGTGLGLSQVYGFVKQSGGHIKIYSEPGEGTTVKLYFPRLQRQSIPDSASNETQRVDAEGQQGETILIVEDDQDVRAYLLDTIRNLKYSVLDAPDPLAALSLIERGSIRIDLLLTDVVMPVMSGRELATRAKTIRPDLKVIFMTGYSRNAIVHQGRLDPDVDLIQKPISQAELASRLRDALDR